MKQNWAVFVEVVTTVKFVVSSSTPEEAERTAERLAQSRSAGSLVEREIISVAAEPHAVEEFEEV